VLKFIRKCQKKEDKNKYELDLEITSAAEKLWCLQVQKESFKEEYSLLQRGKNIQKNSRLYRLSAFMKNGLICVRGRTEYSPEISQEVKQPIILDNKHLYTKLLVMDYHKKYIHAGTQLILNEIRQRYWIIYARKAILNVINSCNACKIR